MDSLWCLPVFFFLRAHDSRLPTCLYASLRQGKFSNFAFSSSTRELGREKRVRPLTQEPLLFSFRQRPYRIEYTGSLPNSAVKRCRARLVLGWGTAWESLWVLLAFCFLYMDGCYTIQGYRLIGIVYCISNRGVAPPPSSPTSAVRLQIIISYAVYVSSCMTGIPSIACIL